MEQSGGRSIVNISSVAGLRGSPGRSQEASAGTRSEAEGIVCGRCADISEAVDRRTRSAPTSERRGIAPRALAAMLRAQLFHPKENGRTAPKAGRRITRKISHRGKPW
jgi:hypothetical protein